MLLRVQSISKSFRTEEGALQVLRDVSLSVSRGESVALTGDSGSGKSTLLHLCAGLDRADSGTIHVADRAVTGQSDAARAALRRDTIGLVFQQFNLISSMSVGANLAFQARLAGREDPVRTAAVAARLGLTDLLARYPENLSGGQQQRVAIGRTLAAAPALVLADEPTGNLDEATGDAVLSLLLEGVAEAGAGLLMVTHSPRLAARCDRRLHLRAGQIVPQP